MLLYATFIVRERYLCDRTTQSCICSAFYSYRYQPRISEGPHDLREICRQFGSQLVSKWFLATAMNVRMKIQV